MLACYYIDNTVNRGQVTNFNSTLGRVILNSSGPILTLLETRPQSSPVLRSNFLRVVDDHGDLKAHTTLPFDSHLMSLYKA